MTLRSSLLPSLDKIRGIPGRLGIRQFSVYLRQELVSDAVDSSHFGQGTVTILETELIEGDGYNYQVKQLSQQEIASSGGSLQFLDFRIGPITPNSGSSGWDPSILNPSPSSGSYRELRIVGPGMPSGALFKVIGVSTSSNFSHYLYARKVGL